MIGWAGLFLTGIASSSLSDATIPRTEKAERDEQEGENRAESQQGDLDVHLDRPSVLVAVAHLLARIRTSSLFEAEELNDFDERWPNQSTRDV